MASSDDEAEVHPQSVSNYHFEDDEQVPVSFSQLPVQWSESEDIDGGSGQVFLDGFADNGLQKVFKHVVSWKFDVSGKKPEMSVLLKGRQWVKLEKPKKWFEGTIRTVLITIHFLHYVQKNPETSAKSLWGYLSKYLSYFEVRPSQNDLLNHLPLIGEAVKRNAILNKSQLLLMVLENPGKVKVLDEEADNLAKPEFIVGDNVIDEADDIIDEAAEESDKDELFDSVCVLCDDGGRLLCCDGICMRSFHATEKDVEADNAECDSLGFTREEVDEIQSFICKNCEYNQHQCFVCGKLGNSNKSSHAEVFKCDVATCGHFYHLHCVAKELGKNIADGESFICPIHSCCVCKEREDKKEHEFQFAVCRRCPIAYHRKCLPREIKIAFKDNKDDIPIRAWQNLLPNNRILIYCLKHELDEELGTPIGDHIQFPKVKHAVEEIDSSLEEETKPSTQDRVLSNKNDVDQDDSTCKRTNPEGSTLIQKSSSKRASLKKDSEHIISGSNVSRKRKANDTVGRHLNEKKNSIPKKSKILDGKSQVSLGQRPCDASMTKGSKKIEFGEREVNGANKSLLVKRTNKELSNASTQIDSDTERRLLDLFKEATSSISLDDVSKKLKFASTHASSLRTYVEKTITSGKLEGSVDAARTALKRLDEGKSIQDAASFCDRDILNQIFKWRDKLRVYLAPILNGNRYTSYGRHFTQVGKLERIVDRLHWYVQSGDTIVDFSCGANDFSILMKKKLGETGKECFYKNYDLLPTKNDFCFEMRDWMEVKPKELRKGSQLIMGLNPPFGVNGELANKFINKALKFQPKLLILTVPRETERLDNKRPPYDLVWEDEDFLSGKSFYLPGSLDINDRQMDDWNNTPPILYLWSRQDWTDKHKSIAQEHGHVPKQHDALIEKRLDEISPADHIMDGNHGDNIMQGHDLPKLDNDPEGAHASRNEGQEENFSHGNLACGNRVVQEHSISKSNKSISNSDKTLLKKRTEENVGKRWDVVSPTNKQVGNDTYDEVMQHNKHKVFTDRQVEEGVLSMPVSPHEVNNGNANENYESTSRFHVTSKRPNHEIQNQNRPTYAFSRSNCGSRNFEDHNSPMLDSPCSFEYRPHFRDEQFRMEADIRQKIRVYGIQEPDYMRSRYQSGDDPAFGPTGTSYGQLSSDPSPSYLTSTIQRYAPRLDGSNYVRTRTLGSELPIIGRNGKIDPRVSPQPGYGALPPQPIYGGPPPQPVYGGPLPQPGYGGPSRGFMHPHNANSRYHSAGWLNE